MRDVPGTPRVVVAARRLRQRSPAASTTSLLAVLAITAFVSTTDAQEVMVLEEDELEVAPERPNARYLLRHTDVRSTGSLLFPELDERLRERAESAEGSGESPDAPEPE